MINDYVKFVIRDEEFIEYDKGKYNVTPVIRNPQLVRITLDIRENVQNKLLNISFNRSNFLDEK